MIKQGSNESHSNNVLARTPLDMSKVEATMYHLQSELSLIG
jgi:hypothetical protein